MASSGGWYYRSDYGNTHAIAYTGHLNQAFGFNDSGADAYLQFHDTATVPPAAGHTAKLSWFVPAGASFSWADALAAGIDFTLGLQWVVSSTPNTYTAQAGNFWVAQRGRTTNQTFP